MAEITDDILLACADENRRGGIKRLFVANVENITSFTAGSEHDYTAVTMDTTSDVFYEIEGEFETISLTQEGSNENGSVLFENTLEVQVPKLEKTKAKDIQDLATSCKLVVIYELYDSTGTYNRAFVLGYDEILKEKGAVRCSVTANVEAELQGLNAYTLTFTGKSAELNREYVGDIETNSSSTVSFGS